MDVTSQKRDEGYWGNRQRRELSSDVQQLADTVRAE